VVRRSPRCNHRVDVAEPEVRLREAEVVRELLARRLRDDPGAREGRQRARLGEDHVSEAREARRHASGRRMREHRDQHPACVLQVPDRHHGLRQLHQREDALLHAAASPRPETEIRRAALLGRPLAGPGEPLADDASHRARP
jgi:hypothetical protein